MTIKERSIKEVGWPFRSWATVFTLQKKSRNEGPEKAGRSVLIKHSRREKLGIAALKAPDKTAADKCIPPWRALRFERLTKEKLCVQEGGRSNTANNGRELFVCVAIEDPKRRIVRRLEKFSGIWERG
ncbi:hypothetical protein KM043_002529 [Ampulex compressa]|nr:hypothetical protein KM043_002529 [Ampulex compressa]